MMPRWVPRCGSVLVLLACLTAAASLDVVIHDIDVTQAAEGQAVTVPVEVYGIEPAALVAFQFEFGIDPTVYEVGSVDRGALIAAQDPALSFPAYAPWLWALEAQLEGAVLRVAGLILMPGAQVQQGTLNTLNLARVPASHGELLRLNLVLRSLAPSPISLLSAGVNLVVDDHATETSQAAIRETANVVPGGSVVGGLPNHWVYRYFGTEGCDPDSDADGDRIANRAEYSADTNPTVPDVRLDLGPGWNLFSLPIAPTQPQPAAALSTAHRRERPDAAPGQPVYDGVVFGWSGRPGAGYVVVASTLEPLQGYWVYVPQPVSLVIPGTMGEQNSVPLHRGWNLVGVIADTMPAAVEGRPIRAAWRWDPAKGFVPVTVLQRSLAYWLFAARAADLTVDPGPVLP